MRLTTLMIKAFVRAVTADIPRVDYTDQVRKILQEQVLIEAPPDVAALYRTNPDYLARTMFFVPRIGSIEVLGRLRGTDDDFDTLPPTMQDAINTLVSLRQKQYDKIKALEISLAGTLQACRTVERARDLLPAELVKYLPQGDAPPPDRTVPAVDVVEKLKEMGWPK